MVFLWIECILDIIFVHILCLELKIYISADDLVFFVFFVSLM